MNGASARLGLNLGLPAVRDFCNRAGLSAVKDVPASIMGASETTVKDLCLAYSSFANGGTRPVQTTILAKIEDSQGNPLWSNPNTKKVRVTDEATAYMITDCLQDAMVVGTGAKSAELGLKQFPVAGKSGTHYEFRDLWFAGYTTAVTCVVWVGMKDRPETLFPEAFSSICALPIWVDTMNAASEKYAAKEFPRPKGVETVNLCSVSGLRATDGCFQVEMDKDTGRRIYVRTVYEELMRPGFKLDSSCDLHASNSVSDIAPEDVPQPPIFLQETRGFTTGSSPVPIPLKSETVIGADPYHAAQPALTANLRVVPSYSGGAGEDAPKLLTKPDLQKPKVDLPEPPPIQID
jgi:penicillin-binding protein 1A